MTAIKIFSEHWQWFTFPDNTAAGYLIMLKLCWELKESAIPSVIYISPESVINTASKSSDSRHISMLLSSPDTKSAVESPSARVPFEEMTVTEESPLSALLPVFGSMI